MKRVKQALSFTAICSLLACLLAAYVPTQADESSPPYQPPFYADNYTVVQDFTNPEYHPWDRDSYGTTVTTESGTPSPDGSAMQLNFNQFGRGQYIFTGLDFSAAEAAEAFVFWFNGDYNGTVHMLFEVATDDSDSAEFSGVDSLQVKLDGSNVIEAPSGTEGVWDNGIGGWKDYEKVAKLGSSGYVIISAENLAAAGIESVADIKRFRFSGPGDGQATDQSGIHPVYVDDFGFVNDLDAFKKAIKSKHDVSALTAAIEAADTLVEADYTPETWEPFAAAVTEAKAVAGEFKDVLVLDRTKEGTTKIAAALAALTAAQGELDEKPESKTYTVTFDSNGGTDVDAQTVSENGKAVKPANPTRNGYTFDGWFHGENVYDFNAAVTADITLTAHWIENEPESDVDKPAYYNDNYTIVQDFTDPDYLPWDRDSYGATVTTESETPSPDGSAMQITFNTWGRGQYVFPGLNFEAAQANDALVFWYDGDFDATICLGIEMATVDSDDAVYTEVDFSYVSYESGKVSQGESGTVGIWDNGIGGWKDYEKKAMLGGTGFLIVSAEDLKAAGIPSVQEVKRIRFGAPGDGQANPSPASQNDEPLKFMIDDIGYVHNVDTFVSDIKTEHETTYLVEPIEPGDVIKLEIAFEGTFADASWTEFANAYQYFVNVYTVDGEAYTYVRTNNTRQTSATLSELLPSTAYVMQVLAMDKDEKVLSASNVVRFTTLEEDKPPYLDGPLPHDESMTIDRVVVSNGTDATVEWEWIDGVFTYTVYLYTVEDSAYTFVEKQDARFGDGSVAFTGLDKSRSYVAQVVAYDVSESIIFAYKPVEFDLSGNANPGGSDTSNEPSSKPGDDKIPSTGVGVPLVATILGLCALAAVAATRKYKAQ